MQACSAMPYESPSASYAPASAPRVSSFEERRVRPAPRNGATCAFGAVEIEAERPGGEYFDADAVMHEILDCDRGARAAADRQRQCAVGQMAAVGVWIHVMSADGAGPVAGRSTGWRRAGRVLGRRGDQGEGRGVSGDSGRLRIQAVFRSPAAHALIQIIAQASRAGPGAGAWVRRGW